MEFPQRILKCLDPITLVKEKISQSFNFGKILKNKSFDFQRQYFMNTQYGLKRKFLIRHHDDDALNGKVCEVLEVIDDNYFDYKVRVTIEGNGSTVVVMPSQLVDVEANLNDVVSCMKANHKFSKSPNPLTSESVSRILDVLRHYCHGISKTDKSIRTDPHGRMMMVDQLLASKRKIPCGAFPTIEDPLLFKSAQEEFKWLATELEMSKGCIGDGFVHFEKFNYLICDCSDVVGKRFHNYLIYGKCHACLIWYFERGASMKTISVEDISKMPEEIQNNLIIIDD